MEQRMSTALTSFDPLPNSIRNGMIALGTCGAVSLLSATSCCLFFTHRLIYWWRFSSHPIARTQVFMLIYNLFVADIIQASSFVISFWWISQNKLVGPSVICNAQGLLIQIGDVASGVWALAIAIHTFVNIVGQRTISHRIFFTSVALLWTFILVLAALGPIRVAENLFVPAGAWCWIGDENDAERLYLHYIWIFISELGSLVLYTFIFCYLRFRITPSPPRPYTSQSATLSTLSTSLINNVLPNGTKSTPCTRQTQNNLSTSESEAVSASRNYILKSSRHMLVYTLAYITLTLPLAAGRAMAMAGRTLSIEFLVGAGTLMACSGFIDVILYVGTRRLLVTSYGNSKSNIVRVENKRYPLAREPCERNGLLITKTTNDSEKSFENILAAVNSVATNMCRGSQEESETRNDRTCRLV